MAPLAPPEQRAACSVMLSPGDHEAIYYYRTRFATTHHTKNPQYSFFSVLFLFAENHPMPMHMVLALSDQDMNYWKRGDFGNSRRSVAHYTSALHLMSKAMSVDGSSPDLDTILATLWLMIVYEQKYGDGQGIGLSKHLQGAASILRTRFKPLLDAFAPLGSASQGRPGIGPAPNVPPGGLISLFAARMVVWMSVLDAGASYGIGGQIGGSINKLVRQIAGDDKVSILRGFAAIHGYSQPLFHATWGNSYPQAELLDDAENRKVYLLYVKTAQLRYETAELMALHKCDPAVAALRLPAVERAFFLVREEFSDLLNIASRLSLELDHSRRLVQNMRFVVPHYYTVVLEFLRFTRFSEPLNDEQRHALHEIMQLAFQGYRYDGEKAIVRIPLLSLFAGMETDDLVHREWILTRYEALCRYGKNYTRAFRFLKAIVEEQARLGERVDTMYLMSSGGFEQFVI